MTASSPDPLYPLRDVDKSAAPPNTELRCWCDLSAYRPHPRTEHPTNERHADG